LHDEKGKGASKKIAAHKSRYFFFGFFLELAFFFAATALSEGTTI